MTHPGFTHTRTHTKLKKASYLTLQKVDQIYAQAVQASF